MCVCLLDKKNTKSLKKNIKFEKEKCNIPDNQFFLNKLLVLILPKLKIPSMLFLDLAKCC